MVSIIIIEYCGYYSSQHIANPLTITISIHTPNTLKTLWLQLTAMQL